MALLPWRGGDGKQISALHWILHTKCILDWKWWKIKNFQQILLVHFTVQISGGDIPYFYSTNFRSNVYAHFFVTQSGNTPYQAMIIDDFVVTSTSSLPLRSCERSGFLREKWTFKFLQVRKCTWTCLCVASSDFLAILLLFGSERTVYTSYSSFQWR